MKKTRRGITDSLIAVGALLLLLVMLVSIDGRIRQEVTAVANGAPGAALTTAAHEGRRSATVVIAAGRDRSIEPAPLPFFAQATVGLVFFMVRT